jgi:hypothetical protein
MLVCVLQATCFRCSMIYINMALQEAEVATGAGSNKERDSS